MKTVALAFRYLWSRPLAAVLNLLLLTLGLASITYVVLLSEQIDRAFERDLAGIDLVVGAKGSPMQLILAGVFHVDTPPGNIPMAEVRRLRGHPMVERLIPMSLGDSFRGYRIVGTNSDYLTHYNASFARGGLWTRPMQAVLGSQAATATGMGLGGRFNGSHGLGAGGSDHDQTPYEVTGVLAPCGCVLDRLILTATESVWQVHEKHEKAGDHDKHVEATAPAAAGSASVPAASQALAGATGTLSATPAAAAPMAPVAAPSTPVAAPSAPVAVREPEREITMALIKYKSPLAAASLPRFVNSSTSMQAASPALEVSRLLRMLGAGAEVLRGLGAVLLLTAALSVFIALWNAVRERRDDLAMLRMLGATPAKVAALLLCEAWWLAVLACVLGLLAGHVLAGATGALLQAEKSIPVTGWIWLPQEIWIAAAALGVATLAALIPSVSAYRVDVARLLNAR